MTAEKKFSWYGLFIWVLVVLYFVYEYALRVITSPVSVEMMESLSLTAEQFAMIGSAYYVTYAFMQIPVGFILDRISARLLVTFACALCGLSMLWLGLSHGFYAAYISRLLMGVGSSFGYLAVMFVTLNWFARKDFAFLTGLGQFFGALGPMIAGAPLAYLVQQYGGNWRIPFTYIAIFGIALAVLISIFLRNKPKTSQSIVFLEKHEPFAKKLLSLVSTTQIWLLILYASLVYVSVPLLGAFWGPAYLESTGIPRTKAALITSFIWLGLAAGSPLLGKLSDLMGKRKPIIVYASLLGIFATGAILYLPIQNSFLLSLFFFLVGFAGASQCLSYAVIVEHSPPAIKTTGLGITNSAVMLASAIIPLFATSLIQGVAGDTDKIPSAAFIAGLSIMPLLFICTFLISLLGIKETFCRVQNQIHHIKRK